MPNPILIETWLDVVESEYLTTFIRDGGSSIKFAVTSDEDRQRLLDATDCCCRKHGYLCLALDAATVRVHLPHEIFFQLARQIDWSLLARRVVLRVAEENGFRVDSIDPESDFVDPEADSGVIDAIAEANDLGRASILYEIRRGVQDQVSRSPEMLRDFREAMRHLCLNQIDADDHPLLQWLRGDGRVSAVRDFSIYTRIDRTTARHFIESTLHWVRSAGYAGTALLLDNSRVTVARNPRDGLRYYTKAMTTDHYELLREFVDDVDRLAGTFLLVASGEGLLDVSRGSRGFSIYEALKTRVMDDVRDRSQPNPVASLVRLH